jgi:two-component system, NarL family, invasion response regulator UvrY
MDTVEQTISDHPIQRRRVLVVDDNADLAQLLGEFIRTDEALEYVGYVRSGAEAIEKARLGAADVFLLDLSLGDASGFQILERLRTDAPAVKVIIHTGHAFEGLGDVLKRSGAAGYVVKDGDPNALLSAIRSAIDDQATTRG